MAPSPGVPPGASATPSTARRPPSRGMLPLATGTAQGAHVLHVPIELAPKHLGGVLGRCRVDRQCRCPFESGNDPQPWVQLPMPMEGLVDALARGCRVQEEVVGRVTQRLEGA